MEDFVHKAEQKLDVLHMLVDLVDRDLRQLPKLTRRAWHLLHSDMIDKLAAAGPCDPRVHKKIYGDFRRKLKNCDQQWRELQKRAQRLELTLHQIAGPSLRADGDKNAGPNQGLELNRKKYEHVKNTCAFENDLETDVDIETTPIPASGKLKQKLSGSLPPINASQRGMTVKGTVPDQPSGDSNTQPFDSGSRIGMRRDPQYFSAKHRSESVQILPDGLDLRDRSTLLNLTLSSTKSPGPHAKCINTKLKERQRSKHTSHSPHPKGRSDI